MDKCVSFVMDSPGLWAKNFAVLYISLRFILGGFMKKAFFASVMFLLAACAGNRTAEPAAATAVEPVAAENQMSAEQQPVSESQAPAEPTTVESAAAENSEPVIQQDSVAAQSSTENQVPAEKTSVADSSKVSEAQVPAEEPKPAQEYVPMSKLPPYDEAAIAASYYTTQLEVLKKGSIEDAKATDWLKFRKEYWRCRLSQSSSSVASMVTGALNSKMNEALRKGDRVAAAKSAKEILDVNFTNMYAHYVVTSDTTADSATIAFHNEALKGLFESIYNSGKGISEETALYVINISEEYDFIGFLGFKFEKQRLVEKNGHYYDIMEASNGATGEARKEYRIYFDVTDFFGHY